MSRFESKLFLQFRLDKLGVWLKSKLSNFSTTDWINLEFGLNQRLSKLFLQFKLVKVFKAG